MNTNKPDVGSMVISIFSTTRMQGYNALKETMFEQFMFIFKGELQLNLKMSIAKLYNLS